MMMTFEIETRLIWLSAFGAWLGLMLTELWRTIG